MADEAQIISGSFKGVPISISSGTVDGGRKIAVKQFPSRDTQSVEDLGLNPRKYALEIILSDKPQQDYFNYRNSLIAALESKGPGELIHPMYGRVDNAVAVSYSLNENFSSFGDSTISVSFEVDDSTGIPESSGNVITQISASNDTVQIAVNDDIAYNFSVTDRFSGNFTAAVDKVNGIIDKAKQSTAFIGEEAQNLNEFAALIGNLADNVNSLVTAPIALADSISSLFESTNGLYSSAGSTFDTFIGFFGFGDDDDPIRLDTAGRIERSSNNDILNGAVSASALGYAYLAITRIDFQTTREIDDLTAELDSQYEAVQENGSSQEVKDAVTDMRVKSLDALEQARVQASQIITVSTNPTTARVLAFNYYGNDDNGDAIAELNGFDDASFIEGDVEVLTV